MYIIQWLLYLVVLCVVCIFQSTQESQFFLIARMMLHRFKQSKTSSNMAINHFTALSRSLYSISEYFTEIYQSGPVY